MADLLQKEYDSIRSEISETCKAPDRWASVLMTLSLALLTLSNTDRIGLINSKLLIIFSATPVIMLDMIIYSSIWKIEGLSDIKASIAKDIKKQVDQNADLSDTERDLVFSCIRLQTDNLKFLMKLISSYIVILSLIFLYSLLYI